MSKVVISGHGKFGSAIKEVINCIAGYQEHFIYIDFLSTDTSDDLEAKYIKVIEDNIADNILFITDIVGATPFKISALLSRKHQNVQVIAGVNLSAILEIIFSLDKELDELINVLINTTKQTIVCYNKK